MRRVAAILAAASLLAIGLWVFKKEPLTPAEIEQINQAWNPPELHQTRGIVMPIVALLQAPSGVSVDTQIPVWGVLLVIIGAVAAFAALKMQMMAHEKNDDERFNATNEMLKEIRGDVKDLLGARIIPHRNHWED